MRAEDALVAQAEQVYEAAIQEQAQEWAPRALRVLYQLMISPESTPSLKRQCANDILARAEGTPEKRAPEMSGTANFTMNVLNFIVNDDGTTSPAPIDVTPDEQGKRAIADAQRLVAEASEEESPVEVLDFQPDELEER